MYKLYLLFAWVSTLANFVVCSDETPSSPIIDPYFPVQDNYKIAMVIYDQFELLDLTGPAEVLGFNKSRFSPQMIGKEGNAFVKTSGFGIRFMTDKSIEEASNEDWDMVIIPGGEDTSVIRKDADFIQKLKTLSNRAKVVFTICTGSIVFAQTGLLDGIYATTNKMGYSLTKNFPETKWIHKARWVHNKKYITTSGISAGMDGATYVLSLAAGKDAAKADTHQMEYEAHWDPNDDPFAR